MSVKDTPKDALLKALGVTESEKAKITDKRGKKIIFRLDKDEDDLIILWILRQGNITNALKYLIEKHIVDNNGNIINLNRVIPGERNVIASLMEKVESNKTDEIKNAVLAHKESMSNNISPISTLKVDNKPVERLEVSEEIGTINSDLRANNSFSEVAELGSDDEVPSLTTFESEEDEDLLADFNPDAKS